MQLGTLSWGQCSFTILKIVGSLRIVLNLLLFSLPVVSDSLHPYELQYLQASLSLTISQSLPKLMSALVMPSSHLILWCPLLFLSSIFPSIRVFFSELALHIRWPKYWSFSFSISPPMSIQGWFPLRLTSLISLVSKGLSGIFSNTTVWRHQFFNTPPSLWFSSHNHTWPLGKP